MAATPPYKVYAYGEYQAACKEPEPALVLADWFGKSAEIRLGHNASDIIWSEGVDGGDTMTYDRAVEIMQMRSKK